ncbi:hypothetical protein VKT23_004477 [Stygiomarasmius scandens]|uniref:Uncharacterized protein n=1 Tax=Marasmiellus scandens TaxID=2682957 RepID=A0ABR1JW47_9AGAR
MQNPRTWLHEYTTTDHDTRSFRRNRLGILAGWKEMPEVYRVLDFTLPQKCPYKGRVVEFKEDRLDDWADNPTRVELYSRNSAQIPFFPGKQMYSSTIPLLLRIDGSKGKFDPTMNPLYFDPDHPYYPFIRRSDNCSLNPTFPEEVPPFLVWRSTRFPEQESGSIQSEYLRILRERIFLLQRRVPTISLSEGAHSWPGFLSSQPSKPTSIPWNGNFLFDDFVDKLSELQQWTKKLAAWVHMGELLMESYLNPSSSVTEGSLQPADDSFIGVWINGMEESQVAWLASVGRIPLFVSHKIEGSKDSPEANKALGTNNPFGFTDWLDNTVLQEWDRLTSSQRCNVVSDCSSDFSSQLYWPSVESAIRNWNSSSLANDFNYPGQDLRKLPSEEVIEGQDRFGPKPWTSRELAPERVNWITPPEVQNVKQEGKWEDFEEITDLETSRQVLRRIGKKAKKGLDDELCLYYDRIRKRRLHLEEKLRIPPGICHDIGVFGLPGPCLPYFTDHNLKFRTSASDWVYLQEKPNANDPNRRASTPPLSSLPLIEIQFSLTNEPIASEINPQNEAMPIDPVEVPLGSDPFQLGTTPSDPSEALPVNDALHRETTLSNQDVTMEEADTSSSQEGLKRKRSPSPDSEEEEEEEEEEVKFPGEDLVIQPVPFLLEWSGRFNYYKAEAPTSILRLEKLDWTLDEFRQFLAKIVDLANSRDVERLKVTRIIRWTGNNKVEFWIKAWNRHQAGWFMQICEGLRMYFVNQSWIKISLLRLDEWRDQNRIHSSNCWEVPTPMDPRKEDEWRRENPLLISRLNIPLDERLSETGPASTSSSQSTDPRPTSENKGQLKRRTRRAGAKTKWIQEQYGPFPVNDPELDFDNWDWIEWIESVWKDNGLKV